MDFILLSTAYIWFTNPPSHDNIKKSKDVKEILSEMVEEERNRKKVTKAGYPYFIEISGFSSGSYSDYFLVTEASLF